MASEPIQLNELSSDPELLNDFISESREHLTAVEMHLLALDQDTAECRSAARHFPGLPYHQRPGRLSGHGRDRR